MTYATSLSSLSPLVPFAVREYARLRAPCLNDLRFYSMTFDGGLNQVYDNQYSVDWLSTVGGLVKLCIQ